jgi:two-component system, NtrC family, response regulator AtoC
VKAATPLVLVVEDDPHIRQLITLVLEDDGLRVAQAKNGREAVDQVRARRPAAVLLDLAMPAVSGLDALAELQRLDRQPPIVICSAGSDREVRAFAAAAHAAGVIRKPFQIEELAATVRRVLSEVPGPVAHAS